MLWESSMISIRSWGVIIEVESIFYLQSNQVINEFIAAIGNQNIGLFSTITSDQSPICCLEPVNTLNRVVFPQLGFPTTPMTCRFATVIDSLPYNFLRGRQPPRVFKNSTNSPVPCSPSNHQEAHEELPWTLYSEPNP